jgi:hypothetical protein
MNHVAVYAPNIDFVFNRGISGNHLRRAICAAKEARGGDGF